MIFQSVLEVRNVLQDRTGFSETGYNYIMSTYVFIMGKQTLLKFAKVDPELVSISS